MTKISIITVCYNSENTIEDSIISVLSQLNCDIEYIIVDGGSSDTTLEIINKYKSQIEIIVSEPDNGIFDAFNKGLKLASGEYIAYLNSDDVYTDCNVLYKVSKVLNDTKPDILCTSIVFIDPINRDIVRKWNVGKYSKWKLYFGWMPPHPGVFLNLNLALRTGNFDKSLRISGDYDYLVRALLNSKFVQTSNEITVNMATGGASNNSLQNLTLKFKEDNYVARKRNLIPYVTPLFKRLFKVAQWFL